MSMTGTIGTGCLVPDHGRAAKETLAFGSCENAGTSDQRGFFHGPLVQMAAEAGLRFLVHYGADLLGTR